MLRIHAAALALLALAVPSVAVQTATAQTPSAQTPSARHRDVAHDERVITRDTTKLHQEVAVRDSIR
ncbi:MAG TPA: hypothetical protein VHR43_12280, partial [Gemmatimonadales bacterium]|nr:hypothetical protein [Gemmatimonadales bacterium]